MAHKESWSVTNYGSRGPRGKTGRGISYLEVDSEGELWAYYTDETNQDIGPMPQGVPGEPGQNGKIVDVIVNGESVVTSEGIAFINASSEGVVYVAGENITIDGNVINAIDTVYTAGDNIEISPENVISANIDDILGQDLLVNVDCGGYYAGDVIEGTTTLRDIIKHLLQKEVPPTPPVVDSWCQGIFNEPPTSLEGSWTITPIDAQETARNGLVKYYTTNRQYIAIAYPASMGNLTSIIQSDSFNVLTSWTRSEVIREGQPYIMYVNIKNKVNESKYEFKWR